MNKKKIAVIVGAILVVIGIVLCIFLIGGNSDDTTDPNVSSTATADEAQTSEEYETLKEKVKDIYDYVPVEPYSFEVEGEVHKVKDLTAFFTYFPSQKLKNKEGNEVLYKEELYEVRNNIEDFNKPIFTEEEIKEFRENYGGHPYGREYFDLNLPGYDYKKNDEYQHSFYNYTMYDNTKEMFLVSTYFASEEEFYQACYDVLLEIMKTKPKDIALSDCLVPKVSDACIDNLELSIEEGDYSLLFDAIMNQTFAFIYTDDNGIWYRIEYADYMLQEDGSRNTILTITSKCTFDDETKYQQ